MHVIVCTHAIQPIQHTHQGEDKKQVELELNMYFGKLMHMTTNAHLKINTDTMHQGVSGSATPKNTMRMLEDELDERGSNQCTSCNRGKSSLQQDVTTRCMHTITDDQAWHQVTTFTITKMSKSWSHHSGPSVSDVLQGLLKPCCLT